MGVGKLRSDDCVYSRGKVGLLLYVDDIILIGKVSGDFSEIKN